MELVIDEEFGRLQQDLETGIFRIVQECLTNIHRHAESKKAWVSVTRFANRVRVEVKDNGKGMPEKYLQGVGLRGMKERALQFRGKMEIESNSGGTTIVAEMPLE